MLSPFKSKKVKTDAASHPDDARGNSFNAVSYPDDFQVAGSSNTVYHQHDAIPVFSSNPVGHQHDALPVRYSNPVSYQDGPGPVTSNTLIHPVDLQAANPVSHLQSSISVIPSIIITPPHDRPSIESSNTVYYQPGTLQVPSFDQISHPRLTSAVDLSNQFSHLQDFISSGDSSHTPFESWCHIAPPLSTQASGLVHHYLAQQLDPEPENSLAQVWKKMEKFIQLRLDLDKEPLASFPSDTKLPQILVQMCDAAQKRSQKTMEMTQLMADIASQVPVFMPE